MPSLASFCWKKQPRGFESQRALIEISAVAKDNHSYVVRQVAKDRSLESHRVAVVPHQGMRVLQIQEPAETVSAGVAAQGSRNIFGEFAFRAGRQLRGSDCRKKIFFTQQCVIAKGVVPLG